MKHKQSKTHQNSFDLSFHEHLGFGQKYCASSVCRVRFAVFACWWCPALDQFSSLWRLFSHWRCAFHQSQCKYCVHCRQTGHYWSMLLCLLSSRVHLDTTEPVAWVDSLRDQRLWFRKTQLATTRKRFIIKKNKTKLFFLLASKLTELRAAIDLDLVSDWFNVINCSLKFFFKYILCVNFCFNLRYFWLIVLCWIIIQSCSVSKQICMTGWWL